MDLELASKQVLPLAAPWCGSLSRSRLQSQMRLQAACLRNSAAGAKTVSTQCNLIMMGSRRSPLWRNTGDSSPAHTAVRHEVASGSGSGSLQAACDQGRTDTGRRSRRTQASASARPSVRSQGLLGCDLTEHRKLLSGALCVCSAGASS